VNDGCYMVMYWSVRAMLFGWNLPSVPPSPSTRDTRQPGRASLRSIAALVVAEQSAESLATDDVVCWNGVN
jgi:hypothetical protein